jgi:predicted membrane metal-binding protein
VIGLNDDLFSSRVKVFPTITSDVVQIDFGVVCPEVDILLTDLSGRTLISEKVRQRNQYTIDLSRMTTGAYQLQIISPSGRKTVQVVRQ